jgi:ethanolamine utilization cobalamin adenosyltransferase
MKEHIVARNHERPTHYPDMLVMMQGSHMIFHQHPTVG